MLARAEDISLLPQRFATWFAARGWAPRPHQLALIEHAMRRESVLLVAPTGGGKTPVIATICSDAVTKWGGRVLVLAHVKELLEQTADKLAKVCPGIPVGIYSAGLKRREKDAPIVVAGIQSVHSKACELGKFDLILVDEAHLIPDSGDGMYREFLAEALVVNPLLRVIGLTATPYRMSTGSICGKDRILNHICYEVGVKELIRDGFLCPVRSKAGQHDADLAGVHIRGGEFIENELQNAMMDPEVMDAAIEEIAKYSAERKSTLLFSCGVEHAQAIAESLAAKTGGNIPEHIACIFGSTPSDERAALLARFKAGDLRYLVNVNVLTTGFDAPNIDCIGMLRPTMSPGLYYQMVGRGFRLAPTKADCLILDFGENVRRHGPVDCIRADGKSKGAGNEPGEAPTKTCEQCREVVAAGYANCPSCGHPFPQREERGGKHARRASEANVISDDTAVEDYDVQDIEFFEHHKKNNPDAPPTLRVAYRISMFETISEWVCFEHPPGFARSKAALWWNARSEWDCPETVERALELCQDGAIAETYAIRIRRATSSKFPEIIGVDLGQKPKAGEYLEPAARPEPVETFDDDDIPF